MTTSGPYVPSMHNTRRYDKLQNLMNTQGMQTKDGVTQKASLIADYIREQYGGVTPLDAKGEAQLVKDLIQGINGNENMAIDMDGGAGQWFNNGIRVFSGGDNLNPRDVLNRIEQQIQQNAISNKENPLNQEVKDAITKYGLKYYPKGHKLEGMRKPTSEMLRDAEEIVKRTSALSEAGITLEEFNPKLQTPYALLGRSDENERKGTTRSQFGSRLKTVTEEKGLATAERDLKIPTAKLKQAGFNRVERQDIINEADRQKKAALVNIQRIEKLMLETGKDLTTHPEYVKSQQILQNPSAGALDFYTRNKGGGQQSSVTPGSDFIPASVVKAAVKPGQAPATAVPPASPAGVPSIGDIEATSKGERTPAEKRAATVLADERLRQQELRLINQAKLNEFTAISNAQNQLNTNITNLKIKKMEQEAELQKFEKQLEYEAKLEQRQNLIDGVTGIGGLFTQFFGNLY